MKYLFINSVIGYSSTGRIVAEKCHELMSEGHECRVAWGRINNNRAENSDITTYRIGNKLDIYTHGIFARLFDGMGLGSKNATKHLLSYIDEYAPDIIWLHNIHGYYLNYKLLFDYIKSKPNIKVYWTLHDCWTMTGHCAFFGYTDCDGMQRECKCRCLEKKNYPVCNGISRAAKNFQQKKQAFTGVRDLTIITPCKWLSDVVKNSYLKDYPVEVVYNTIDTNVFKPTESNFRKENQLEDKIILLGVANDWDARKGLNDFVLLSEKMSIDYPNVRVVIVGANEKQKRMLEKYPNIIAILRTRDVAELAGLYTTADAFLNLTYADNYPSTNLEARACGTTVITYNTGGSPESVPEDCVAQKGKIEDVIRILHEHSIIN